MTTKFIIEDAFHCELDEEYKTFEDALNEIKKRTTIPWNQKPNRPPCKSWEQCQRIYHIVEYQCDNKPWKKIQEWPIVGIERDKITWLSKES